MKQSNLPIGTKAYPADNSYSICLTNPELKKPYLAGWLDKSREKAKRITIKSDPFETIVKSCLGNHHKKMMVAVYWRGNTYLVLDLFTIENPN